MKHGRRLHRYWSNYVLAIFTSRVRYRITRDRGHCRSQLVGKDSKECEDVKIFELEGSEVASLRTSYDTG